jgi:preprotein translocase subunit SecD
MGVRRWVMAVLLAAAPAAAVHAAPLPVEGSYVIVDLDAWGQRQAQIDQDRDDLMRTLDAAGIGYASPHSEGPVTTFRLADPGQYNAAVRALKSFTINDVPAVVTPEPDGRTKVVIPNAWTDPGGANELDAAVNEVVERAQARGFAEPDTVDLNPRRVRIDFPGVADAELMRGLRRPEPRLTVQLVDDHASIEEARKGRIAGDDELAPCDLTGEPFLVVKRQVLLSGDNIQDAEADTDQKGQPSVLMRFDRRGADLFAQVTQRHMGQRFAVLLNGRVIFAPTISMVVTDGVGQISGDLTDGEAEGLAKAIRSSAPLSPLVVEDGPLPYHDAHVGPR